MTLVPVDTTSALAVTDYLTKARDWLSTAVETSTPIGIAGAKVEIAVAAEATKQLGLSQEIQIEAAEMVRRAEYTLRKATKKAQDEGEMRSRQTNLQVGRSAGTSASEDMPTPRQFFATESEYRDANVMAELSEDEFEAVIAEAKAEGNVSRPAIVAKAREKSGRTPRATRRAALPDFARDAADDLLRIAERLERITQDDRFTTNREAISRLAGGSINRSLELITEFRDVIRNDETTS